MYAIQRLENIEFTIDKTFQSFVNKYQDHMKALGK